MTCPKLGQLTVKDSWVEDISCFSKSCHLRSVIWWKDLSSTKPQVVVNVWSESSPGSSVRGRRIFNDMVDRANDVIHDRYVFVTKALLHLLEKACLELIHGVTKLCKGKVLLSRLMTHRPHFHQVVCCLKRHSILLVSWIVKHIIQCLATLNQVVMDPACSIHSHNSIWATSHWVG